MLITSRFDKHIWQLYVYLSSVVEEILSYSTIFTYTYLYHSVKL